MAVYAGTELVSGGIFEELGHINDKNNPHEVNAGQVAYGDTTVSAQLSSIASEMGDLKNSVSNGKQLVADAITSKGQTTASNASFADMAANIDKIKLGSGNAVASQVLSDITFSNSSGEELTGTMPNRGAVQGAITVASNSTIGTAGTAYYTIPAGYHDGSGVARVTSIVNLAAGNIKSGVTIANTTGTFASDANAAASQILSGKTAYGPITGGVGKITGTLTEYGTEPAAKSATLWSDHFYFYVPDYNTGVNGQTAGQERGVIQRGIKYPKTSFGNAAAANVLSGVTFTSSVGLNQTGTMTNRGSVACTISPGKDAKSYTVPAGYHNGNGKVTVNGDANLVASNIKSGVTIFGVTGNCPITLLQGGTTKTGTTYGSYSSSESRHSIGLYSPNFVYEWSVNGEGNRGDENSYPMDSYPPYLTYTPEYGWSIMNGFGATYTVKYVQCSSVISVSNSNCKGYSNKQEIPSNCIGIQYENLLIPYPFNSIGGGGGATANYWADYVYITNIGTKKYIWHSYSWNKPMYFFCV